MTRLTSLCLWDRFRYTNTCTSARWRSLAFYVFCCLLYYRDRRICVILCIANQCSYWILPRTENHSLCKLNTTTFTMSCCNTPAE